MPLFPRLWAFYKRDWQSALTYRTTFLMDMAQPVALIFCFFFISKLVTAEGTHPHLAPYGGDYFQFVFLGIAFSGLMTTALNSLNQSITHERAHGTLEAILLTPTPFATTALAKVTLDLGQMTVKLIFYFLLGIFLFRADFSQANWTVLIPTVLLTVGLFLGMGLLSAGFLLLTREISPLQRLFDWGSRFLAGVFFPIAALPEGLRQISHWLPLTYTLEAVRKSLIQGASFQTLGRELGILFGFCLFLLPLGLLYFRWAFREARRRGVLGFEV